ncbi:vWA domain-containing protein [Gracilibacillus thailandensis]|uniref:VWA domain-containing protein n=1 Tax=Gracilibacillus thailandensis TaxID=563735 RepID=A0A6N7R2I9_9BACI|nr:VWA domain-containing protein [Gracilibacillus thailandensis]MRI66999.1 VWA domain-containing protein [Gracilibacillus thailandensis]
MRKYIMLLLLVVITIGCSNEDARQSEEVEEESKEEQVNKDEENTDQSDEVSSTLSEISISSELEVIKQLSPGQLTKELSYEEETEGVLWGIDDLDQGFLEELKDAIQSDLTVTDHPETFLKTLIYYAGSPYHSQLLSELEDYHPNYQEPLLPRPETVEDEENEASDYAYILLDASSSMLMEAEDESKQRMAIAKDAVESFAKTIGESSDVSLVAFGHKGDDSDSGKEKSCSGIEEVYPLGSFEGEKFHEAVSSVEAKGWTPLAAAIEEVMELSAEQEGNVTVYIVSDGVETCDGDPVKAAENFVKNSDDEGTVNIIGFQVDQEAEEQLTAVAEAGQGEYYAANNSEELQSTIEYEWLPSMTELAWAPVNLAPVGWEIMRKQEEVNEISSDWSAVISREDHRFRSVVSLLEEEEWIPEEKVTQLEEIMDERKQALEDLNATLRDEKKTLVDTEAKEIKEEVEEWVEEMRELREASSS